MEYKKIIKDNYEIYYYKTNKFKSINITTISVDDFNKDNIMKYNRTLRTLASEKGCYFLDVYSALVDTDGNLPTEMSWDGIHLTADGYGVWENYIRTHYE